jgi:alkylation response protein AidB-like acyl-CoA dehydrogenase
MRRRVFDSDHHLFRESVRQFVERTLLPVDERTRDERSLSREVWLEAGRQGFLGMQVPEEYGGQDAGDFRFNAVIGEELAAVAAAYNSMFAITSTCARRTCWSWPPRRRRSAGCPVSAPARSSPRSR